MTYYNVLAFVTNDKDQYSASVKAEHLPLTSAKVNYHNICASFHNASDVKLACVKLVTEYGYDVEGFTEIIDHTVTEEVTE